MWLVYGITRIFNQNTCNRKRNNQNNRYFYSKVTMRPKWTTVFVTGGSGYIGSHCVVELLQAGYDVIAVDNFVNSAGEGGQSLSLKRAEEITGKPVTFYKCDLLHMEELDEIFKKVYPFILIMNGI